MHISFWGSSFVVALSWLGDTFNTCSLLPMRYGEPDYQKDLLDPSMPHLQSRERFKAFYEHLANGPAKDVQYPAQRMGFVTPSLGGNLLELGCHVAYNLIYWTALDQTLMVTGVDVSSTMLDHARRRIEVLPSSQASRISLIQSFIEDFTSGDTYTDVVLTETLEHVQDPLPVIGQAVRLMSPDTVLWISTPSRRWGNYSHVRGIGQAEMGKMLADAGCTQINCWQQPMGGEQTTFAVVKL